MAASARTTALVVGIDHYRANELKDVRGPVTEAIEVTKYLVTVAGVPAGNIYLFLEPGEGEPLPAGIPAGVQQGEASEELLMLFLQEKLTTLEGDVLLVYWAGHGAQVGNERILFLEGRGTNYTQSISLEDLIDRLSLSEDVRFKEVVFLVDACANLLTNLQQERNAAVGVALGPCVRVPRPYQTFFSCAPGRSAYVDMKAAPPRCVFTRTLLQQLGGGRFEPLHRNITRLQREMENVLARGLAGVAGGYGASPPQYNARQWPLGDAAADEEAALRFGAAIPEFDHNEKLLGCNRERNTATFLRYCTQWNGVTPAYFVLPCTVDQFPDTFVKRLRREELRIFVKLSPDLMNTVSSLLAAKISLLEDVSLQDLKKFPRYRDMLIGIKAEKLQEQIQAGVGINGTSSLSPQTLAPPQPLVVVRTSILEKEWIEDRRTVEEALGILVEVCNRYLAAHALQRLMVFVDVQCRPAQDAGPASSGSEKEPLCNDVLKRLKKLKAEAYLLERLGCVGKTDVLKWLELKCYDVFEYEGLAPVILNGIYQGWGQDCLPMEAVHLGFDRIVKRLRCGSAQTNGNGRDAN